MIPCNTLFQFVTLIERITRDVSYYVQGKKGPFINCVLSPDYSKTRLRQDTQFLRALEPCFIFRNHHELLWPLFIESPEFNYVSLEINNAFDAGGPRSRALKEFFHHVI